MTRGVTPSSGGSAIRYASHTETCEEGAMMTDERTPADTPEEEKKDKDFRDQEELVAPEEKFTWLPEPEPTEGDAPLP